MQYHEDLTVKICLYPPISWESPKYYQFQSISIKRIFQRNGQNIEGIPYSVYERKLLYFRWRDVLSQSVNKKREILKTDWLVCLVSGQIALISRNVLPQISGLFIFKRYPCTSTYMPSIQIHMYKPIIMSKSIVWINDKKYLKKMLFF